jgi:hypothetical protein
MNPQFYSLCRWYIIENMLTVTATAALVLGLYYLGAGAWAAGGLILLININSPPTLAD